jgi:hypothetical protein
MGKDRRPLSNPDLDKRIIDLSPVVHVIDPPGVQHMILPTSSSESMEKFLINRQIDMRKRRNNNAI